MMLLLLYKLQNNATIKKWYRSFATFEYERDCCSETHIDIPQYNNNTAR